MNKFSVADAKAHFSEILMDAEQGIEVLITRHGTPIARLSGLGKPKRALNLQPVDAFRASLKPSGEKAVDLVRRMRDGAY